MKKVIISAAILCTVICIGLCEQSTGETEPASVTAPMPAQTEVAEMPMPKIKITVPKTEEPEELIIEGTMPMPTVTSEPTPASTSTPTSVPTSEPVSVQPTTTPASATASDATQPVQAGDLVYVPGFGWLESQGEGTVIHDDMMHENGNKVGIMD